MAISPSDSPLFEPLFGDAELTELFSDERFIRDLLKVETALAGVQGRLGILPFDATLRIEETIATFRVDFHALKEGLERHGVPVKELIRQLRSAVGGQEARYVHYGATTQDIMDTALILRLRDVSYLLEKKLFRVVKRLADLADLHRGTLMAGRTHAQQALPITFGLKAAGWLVPLLRHIERLNQLRPRLLVVQFGGAAGTLASLGAMGTKVRDALAGALGIGVPVMPWHTQRDSLVEFAGWLALVSGSLAKMAQDIILLSQTEVGEVSESSDTSRGGSSTMPQKNNPVVSELVVAAARANASLLSALHASLIQEHERGTHGWQVEWMTLPQMIAWTATGLNKAIFLSENLVVDAERMRKNVDASNGMILAEALRMALIEHVNADIAGRITRRAVEAAVREKRNLIDVAKEATRAPLDWELLRNETTYLGSANVFVDRVLAESKRIVPSFE